MLCRVMGELGSHCELLSSGTERSSLDFLYQYLDI